MTSITRLALAGFACFTVSLRFLGRTRRPSCGGYPSAGHRKFGGEDFRDHALSGSLQALDQAGADRGNRLGRGDRGQAHPDQRARRALRQPGADSGECRRATSCRPPWWRSRRASTWRCCKLDDPTFFDTHPPVARASKLPQIKDAVLAYGFPTGGNSLSITKGIVSRIEFVSLQLSGVRPAHPDRRGHQSRQQRRPGDRRRQNDRPRLQPAGRRQLRTSATSSPTKKSICS